MKPNLDDDPQVSMTIDKHEIKKAIVDGGSAVNVLPESTWNTIGKPNLSPARFTLTKADQSKVQPMGVIISIPVNVAGIRIH